MKLENVKLSRGWTQEVIETDLIHLYLFSTEAIAWQEHYPSDHYWCSLRNNSYCIAWGNPIPPLPTQITDNISPNKSFSGFDVSVYILSTPEPCLEPRGFISFSQNYFWLNAEYMNYYRIKSLSVNRNIFLFWLLVNRIVEDKYISDRFIHWNIFM